MAYYIYEHDRGRARRFSWDITEGFLAFFATRTKSIFFQHDSEEEWL